MNDKKRARRLGRNPLEKAGTAFVVRSRVPKLLFVCERPQSESDTGFASRSDM